ncbi:MAG TPA: polysaccharide deacetylase family protein [Clostridiales bacterium]|nr:polysaccharide deacetylase family protein [Clostridiales bacterium]
MKKIKQITIIMFLIIAIKMPVFAQKSCHVPILMYHHLSDNANQWNSSTVSPAKFEEDMIALKGAGYTTILPEDIINHKDNSVALPPKPLMITFDDGYSSNYELAFQTLKKHNMKAVIHVVTSSRGKTPGYIPHFSWEQAKEMEDSGLISIQSHTFDMHTGLGYGKLAEESRVNHKSRMIKDFMKSTQDIKKHIDKEVVMFAYPYGISDSYSDKTLEPYGAKITLTVKEGIADINKGLHSLPRINVPSDLTSEDLVKKINSLKIKKRQLTTLK